VTGPRIVGLASSAEHAFSKAPRDRLELVAGVGVAGDSHAGEKVQHLSRVRKDPAQPNLRQVHLIHAELFDEMAALGFAVAAGELGENITTRGVDLLGLPTGARLRIGEAVIRITGLRNPCWQIDAFREGLLAHMVERRPDGSLARKCGVMAVVERGGAIELGAPITIEAPDGPHRPLEPV
jgi:MOSC domain-containing protein YiiM